MKEFFIVLGIMLVVFLLVLIINALRVKLTARKLTSRKQHKTPEEQTEYALKLGKMIRCETVSVEGSFDDTEFKKLRDVMAELFPLVHKTAEKMIFGDDCWIYKIKGKDQSRNIMIMSHHDVVAVEGDWKYPGFAVKFTTAHFGAEERLILKHRFLQSLWLWKNCWERVFSPKPMFT